MRDHASWGRDEFMSRLFERFPNLAAERDPDRAGLLHCEMGWFSNKTSAAIEAHDFSLVRTHFEFIDEALVHASDALENAILVSYLENVFALNTRHTARARDLLTPGLSVPVIEMEEHFIARVDGVLPPVRRDGDQQSRDELTRRLLLMMSAGLTSNMSDTIEMEWQRRLVELLDEAIHIGIDLRNVHTSAHSGDCDHLFRRIATTCSGPSRPVEAGAD
jgi:hypothetical protein